jgi:FKBP-type peptidyl-prolyl cis-trans isomerase 2
MRKVFIIILTAVILFSGCVEKKVKTGDNISIDYTGSLEDGKVFETSLEKVATENQLFDPMQKYTPLNFTVGNMEVIKGMDDGVIGMKVGESKTLKITPENGYGNIDPNKIIVVPRLQVIPSVFPKKEEREIPIESFEGTFGSGHKVGETIIVPNDPNISVTIQNITSKDLFNFFEPNSAYELIKYLNQEYGIDFPIYATVKMNEKTGQIFISHEKKEISLRLNDDRSSATIQLYDGRTVKLNVKNEGQGQTIYTTNVSFIINNNHQVGDKIENGFPWNITIINVDDKNITVKHNVEKNFTFQPRGTPWNTTVVGLDNDSITLSNNLLSETVNSGIYGNMKVSFNETSIIIDQNDKLAGKTLLFNVTLVSINK